VGILNSAFSGYGFDMVLSDAEAIIFDNDGVLVDSEVIHLAVERDLLAELGLKYSHEAYMVRFVGLSDTDYRAQIGDDYSRLTGGVFPADFWDHLFNRVWSRIRIELKAMDGVASLVRGFDGKVAIGSSAPYDHLCEKLRIARLFDLFEPHIYSAEHVAKGKPAPDLFLYAATQLGVEPSRCIVVEDSIHGIAAAVAAGMKPIGFAGGGHADAGLRDRLLNAGACIVVRSHTEIQSLLRSVAEK
jgi:HAD superfamily hydrolase (TIGR01509 family)